MEILGGLNPESKEFSESLPSFCIGYLRGVFILLTEEGSALNILMKTFIGINTLTGVEQIVYSNHIAFFYRLGKTHPEDTFGLFTPRRMGIDRMRNQCAKMAIEADFDYLMFIDDDVIIPLDIFDKLQKADKDIIAGWTLIRGYPYDNMYFEFKDATDGPAGRQLVASKDTKREDRIIPVDAVGFSTALIKVSLLKKIPPPWFVTGPTNTEDIYFCLKARQYVKDVTIAVDKSVETAHVLGPEFIAPWNREDYSNYIMKQDPSTGKKDIPPFLEESGDRGEEYVKMVKGAIPQRSEEKKAFNFGKLNLPETPHEKA